MNDTTPMSKTTTQILLFLSCVLFSASASAATTTDTTVGSDSTQIAVFAGGCFWCVESDFDAVPGVIRTTSGYTGGQLKNPDYRRVTAGGTGHREAVEIEFDPKRVTYAQMLDIFWRSVDPTDGGGQFCDRGESYTTAIFAKSPMQHQLALASKAEIDQAGTLPKPIATKIENASTFYPAEDYHQDYYNKNPVRYNFYRYSCRRDSRIEQLWGDQALRGIKKH